LGELSRRGARSSVSSRSSSASRSAPDQARISRIENAGDNPSYGLVERIAKALGWELWELAKLADELEVRENPPPNEPPRPTG
jgi:transcriptional regulator with XRE-family HTH domain